MLACLLPVVTIASAAAVLPESPRDSWSAASLERVLLAEMKDTQTPGTAVAVLRGGEVVLLRGYGVASVETGEPVTGDTLFRIGSTTKMFTGLAAAQLAAEGRLAFDVPISKYVRDLHPVVGALTLHQLLSHTAGVISEGSADGSHDDAALERRVKTWTGTHLFAPPGDVYSYSSPGYWLAGHVLEAVTQQPFADVVADKVLRPAGMARSTFRPFVAMTYPRVQDHRMADGKPVVVRPFPDDVSTWPGGSLFSSARELAAFASVLLSGGKAGTRQIIPEAALRHITTRQSETGDGCGYTYGLADCTTQGVRTLSHYGFRSGSGSIVSVAPAQGVAIVILANRAGGILRKTEGAAKRMLLGIREETEEPSPSRPPIDPASLAGLYVHGPDAFTLTATAGGAKYQFRDKEAAPVKGVDEDAIAVLDPSGAAVQFFRVVKGRLTGDVYLTDGLTAFRRQ